MKIQFGCEREFICGSANSQAINERNTVQRDAIFGRPVMLEIFDKLALKLSPGSGVVHAQVTGHSSAMASLMGMQQESSEL